MSAIKLVPAGIGIDVSKNKLDLAFVFPDQANAKYTFNNSKAGVSELLDCLKKQRAAATVPCIIESTGNYHLQSAIMIARAGYAVKLINPLITKKYQKSSIRNAKSDSIDAERLANIGIMEPKLTAFEANSKAITNKKLVSYIASLEKTRQKLKAS